MEFYYISTNLCFKFPLALCGIWNFNITLENRNDATELLHKFTMKYFSNKNSSNWLFLFFSSRVRLGKSLVWFAFVSGDLTN
jgi:hypothetical protein